MNQQQTLALFECVRGSFTGDRTFPEIVARLIDIGIERYHADFSRHEITYYLPSGDSLVVPAPHDSYPTGQQFDATAVETAIRQSQRNEHTYPDFIRKTMAAGCIGYFVQITGRRAIYFGRNGESHIEPFPSAPSP